MGVKVEGVETLMFILKQGGEKAVRGAHKAMEVEGAEIAKLARKMAPVDQGNLEKSIKSRSSGRIRDRSGRFAKQQITIEIDGDVEVPTSKKGKVVGDYAYLIHEYMTPYGSKYKLGEKSKAKQAAQPGIIVGGGFLDRAVAEREKEMVNRIISAVSRGLDGDEFDGQVDDDIYDE